MYPYFLAALVFIWVLFNRCHAGWVVDSEFGNRGIVTIQRSEKFTFLRGILRGRNFNLLYGEGLEAGRGIGILKKLDRNGKSDRSFGRNGYVAITTELDSENHILFADLRPDATVIILGVISSLNGERSGPSERNIFVAKVLPSGSLDLRFGKEGFLRFGRH